MTQRSSHS